MVQKPWFLRFSLKLNLNSINIGMMLWNCKINQTIPNFMEYECDHCLEVAD